MDRGHGQLEAAITLNPSHARAHTHRGLAHAQLGNADLAIADLEQARSLSDDDLGTRCIVEDALQSMRDR